MFDSAGYLRHSPANEAAAVGGVAHALLPLYQTVHGVSHVIVARYGPGCEVLVIEGVQSDPEFQTRRSDHVVAIYVGGRINGRKKET